MAIIVLDASVIIGFLDGADVHHARAVAALSAIEGAEVVLPATAYAQVLVGRGAVVPPPWIPSSGSSPSFRCVSSP